MGKQRRVRVLFGLNTNLIALEYMAYRFEINGNILDGAGKVLDMLLEV